jgi:uncharacterized protein YutE (UPF0331/DUF86 family)
MTPSGVDLKVVGDRARSVRKMIGQLQQLPTASASQFIEDFRTAAAAESLLRRAIEAILDMARHLLAKGHGIGALEYREVARVAAERGLVGDLQLRERFVQIAGFRNRLTHFYDEVTPEELRAILVRDLADLERLVTELEKSAVGLVQRREP